MSNLVPFVVYRESRILWRGLCKPEDVSLQEGGSKSVLQAEGDAIRHNVAIGPNGEPMIVEATPEEQAARINPRLHLVQSRRRR